MGVTKPGGGAALLNKGVREGPPHPRRRGGTRQEGGQKGQAWAAAAAENIRPSAGRGKSATVGRQERRKCLLNSSLHEGGRLPHNPACSWAGA